MTLRVLQINANHDAIAQDLLCQNVAKWGVGLAIVAEPYFVPNRTDWLSDGPGSVAVIDGGGPNSPPLTLFERGEGYVVVKWGETVVVDIYCSPNRDFPTLERLLDKGGGVIRRSLHRPVIVAGDPNAKSSKWGSPVTNARGVALVEWAEEIGLEVLN
ncbi:uncharacterized protein [Anoplolepis gracilipes]|uniref:uncharacterized protein n=1 Tax=Anoplolepis gracilipes TaxID=354296 RepID=UPI003BA12BB6